MFIHLVCNWHIGPKTACLFAKNMLATKCNTFDAEHHGLGIPNGNYEIVAQCLRQKISKGTLNDDVLDRHFGTQIINLLSRCQNEEDVSKFISKAVSILKAKTDRWRLFTGKNYIKGRLLELLENGYAGANGRYGANMQARRAVGDISPPGLSWQNDTQRWKIKLNIKGKEESIGAIWKKEEEAAAISALERARAKCSDVEHLIDDTNRKRYVGMIKEAANPLPEGRKKCNAGCGKTAGKNWNFCTNRGCREERKKAKTLLFK